MATHLHQFLWKRLTKKQKNHIKKINTIGNTYTNNILHVFFPSNYLLHYRVALELMIRYIRK